MNNRGLILLAVAFSVRAFAESPTVLMQRAIFLEETAGDIDGAIKLYREVLAGGAAAKEYAADAERRVGECQRMKEDHQPAKQNPQPYWNHEGHFSFDAPAAWKIQTRPPSQGGGSCADIREPENKAIVTICAKPARALPASIREYLLIGEIAAVERRRTVFPDFRLREESPARGRVGGERALTVLADYTSKGQPMTEWVTWVQSETTRSSITVEAPTRDIEAFRSRFAPILASFRLR